MNGQGALTACGSEQRSEQSCSPSPRHAPRAPPGEGESFSWELSLEGLPVEPGQSLGPRGAPQEGTG